MIHHVMSSSCLRVNQPKTSVMECFWAIENQGMFVLLVLDSSQIWLADLQFHVIKKLYRSTSRDFCIDVSRFIEIFRSHILLLVFVETLGIALWMVDSQNDPLQGYISSIFVSLWGRDLPKTFISFEIVDACRPRLGFDSAGQQLSSGYIAYEHTLKS